MDDWAVVLITCLASKPPPTPCGTVFPRTIYFNCNKFVGLAISPSGRRSLHAPGTLLALKQVYRLPRRVPTAFLGGLMPQ